MRTFAIKTLGCKVNQYESQQIRQLLEALGLRPAENINEKVDLIVINTCCVTHTASAKSRQYIRKAQRLNPAALKVVVGCLPTVESDELRKLGDDIYLLGHQHCLATFLRRTVNSALRQEQERLKQPAFTHPDDSIRPENGFKVKSKNELFDCPDLGPISAFVGQRRAFLKIQDGCDGWCSYCIIPRTRPVVSSKPVETVLEEAKALVASGHKEIVITGIFLGAYGQQSVRRNTWPGGQNYKLAELLEQLAEIRGLERIRLSSLEPADVNRRLLDVLSKHRKIMPHLHLSLQSGSDAILKRMRRQYSVADFRAAVEAIKAELDRPAITTDIIVGFPGETDIDFEQTVKLAEQVGFAKMHVFSFSPRRGTAAAKMKEVVDSRVKKRRSEILRQLDRELGSKFRNQFIGETVSVLLENSRGRVAGRSERYFMVLFEQKSPKLAVNQIVKARIIKNTPTGVIGQVID